MLGRKFEKHYFESAQIVYFVQALCRRAWGEKTVFMSVGAKKHAKRAVLCNLQTTDLLSIDEVKYGFIFHNDECAATIVILF